MQPRRAGTIWSNDDVALAQATKQGLPPPPSQAKQPNKAAKRSATAADSSDDEAEYQDLPSSRDADSASNSDVEDQPDAAVLDEGLSDMDYLKSRMKADAGAADVEERSSSQTSSLTDTHQAEEEQAATSAESDAALLEADSEAEEARQQDRRASHAQAGTKDASTETTAEGLYTDVQYCTTAIIVCKWRHKITWEL